jgi:transposase
MVAHLSNPLRELIIAWFNEDHVVASEIAQRARCHITTVYKVLQRWKNSRNPHALARGHARYLIDENDIRYILALLQANPALFLDELQLRLYTDRYLWVSIATISRSLARHGYSHKKLAKQAAERNAFLRACWLVKYGDIPAECCVWLDESGVDDRDHFRVNGWSQVGVAPVCCDLFARDVRLTMIPALTVDGIIAMDVFDGGVGKEQFLIL